MKKTIIFVLLAIGFFVISSTISAEENKTRMEVNQKGEVRFVETENEWRKVTEEEKLAIESPGKEIPINFKNETERVSFFYFLIKKQSNEAVVFRDGKLETIEKLTEGGGEKQLVVYIIFLLLAILLMAISNFFYAKSNSNSVTMVFAAIAFLFTAFSFITFAAAASLAASFVALLAAAVDDNKKYQLFIVIFYIAAIIALFI